MSAEATTIFYLYIGIGIVLGAIMSGVAIYQDKEHLVFKTMLLFSTIWPLLMLMIFGILIASIFDDQNR